MPMKPLRTLVTTLLWMLLAGCQSHSPLPIRAGDNTAALLAHPQFNAAAQAAPDFTKQALRTITRLETELGNAGH